MAASAARRGVLPARRADRDRVQPANYIGDPSRRARPDEGLACFISTAAFVRAVNGVAQLSHRSGPCTVDGRQPVGQKRVEFFDELSLPSCYPRSR
jgi:hypothetical protein